MTEKRSFGRLASGEEVSLYTITNRSGMRANVTNFGAALVSLFVPDRNGKTEDVVLGYDSLDGYVNDRFYVGFVVGRYANRIARGAWKLEGAEYRVTVNEGHNHLHGGFHGFHKVLWKTGPIHGGSDQSLNLRHVSEDGDEGYPGKVDMEVVYSITDKDELVINYTGTTDRTTVLNTTQHSYFNLAGNPRATILDHHLQMEADSFTPVDGELITTGDIDPVANTPMDFRRLTPVGAHINDSDEQLAFGRGYDHNWVLSGYDGRIRRVGELYDPVSGRLMTMFTDQPGLQCCSGNTLDGIVTGKSGIALRARTGICLEAQHFPDSPNKPWFPSAVVRPRQVYRQTTIYQFSIR